MSVAFLSKEGYEGTLNEEGYEVIKRIISGSEASAKIGQCCKTGIIYTEFGDSFLYRKE